MRRTDEYDVLKPDQVLLIKDFILEDVIPGRVSTRAVDVPAPFSGVISLRDDKNGLVEIKDGVDGEIVARVRHLHPIDVKVGDKVVYGQSLGTQHEWGLDPGTGKHVHIEMDTRHFQELRNYVNDLVSGRLPVQASLR